MNGNTPAYRVWNLSAPILDGAVVSATSHRVKVERVGDALTV